MRMSARILTTLAGVFLLWMAVSMALGFTLIRPSATGEGHAPLEITRTWYGEAARFGAAGLLGFFGLTLALAPWRAPPSASKDER